MGFMENLIKYYKETLNKNMELQENREVSLLFLRFCTFFFNSFVLIIILDVNIFIAILICMFLNKIMWDLLTTWYIGDFLQGNIIYWESKHINKKIYFIIITVIDTYFWIKNYKKKDNPTTKKFDKKLILIILIKLLKFLYKIYSIFIYILYLKLPKKEIELNIFWERLNFQKLNENLNIKNYKSNNAIIEKKFKILQKIDISSTIDQLELWEFYKKILLKNIKNVNLLYNKIYSIKKFIVFIKYLWKIFLLGNLRFLKISIYIVYLSYLKIKYILFFYYNKFIISYNYNKIMYIIYTYIYNYYNIYIYSIYINIIIYIFNKLNSNNNKNNSLIIYLYYNIYYNKHINKFINLIINKLLNIVNYKLKELNLENKLETLKIFINNCIIYIINIKIIDIINFFKNYINIFKSIKFKKIWLEIQIFYVNSKRPWKQFKYDKSLYIVKYLDGLEYAMLTHKKFFQGKNIEKFKKKKYIVKKIPSVIEKELTIYKINTKNKILAWIKIIEPKLKTNLYLKNFINVEYNFNIYIYNLNTLDLIINIINIWINKIIPCLFNILLKKYENFIIINFIKIYNIYLYNINLKYTNITINLTNLEKIINIYNNKLKSFKEKFNNKIIILTILKFKNNILNLKNNINNITIPENIKYCFIIYLPFITINYIISDVAISITVLRKKIRKKKIRKLETKLFNIYMYIKNKTKKYYNRLKNLIKFSIYFAFSKTIYITFLCAYFFNSHTTEYLNKNFIKKRLFYTFNDIEFINYILINKNIFYVLITILGLTLTIKWSRYVHSFFGNYLWTMTIFPIFLESHKILYLKLLNLNFLNFNKFENIYLLKFNILELFNYKLYNIYNTVSIIIIFFFIIYSIKHEAFRTVYANLRAARWKYVKYPLIIFLLELSRYKLVEITSVFTLYISSVYNIQNYYITTYLWLNQLYLTKSFIYIINRFFIELGEFPYYTIYYINIPNIYLTNLILDILIAYLGLTWLISYLNKYVKADKKFVAFPLVTSEYILKYIIYFYIAYYSYFFLYGLATDSRGKIFEYIAIIITATYVYLEIRVHKVPRKTMAWYFRQIVELWPTTALNIWTLPKFLYSDQQRYLSMRKKFKKHKDQVRDSYNKSELWNKKITLAYQRDKECNLYIFSSFCRLMYRKESMLKEFNIYDYHGWQQDWTINYKKINIYRWKLDWWDKPYIYLFRKNIFFTNVKDYYFSYFSLIYRFSCKFNYLTILFFIVKMYDHYYTNKYIWINDLEEEEDYANLNHRLLFRGKKYKNLCKEWKLDLAGKDDKLENLKKLKRLKRVLMEFSSGKRLKTPDWVFPMDFEKQYKKDGWKMFENPDIDNVELDWRPGFSEW